MRLPSTTLDRLHAFGKRVAAMGLPEFIQNHHTRAPPMPDHMMVLLTHLLEISPDRRWTAAAGAAFLKKFRHV